MFRPSVYLEKLKINSDKIKSSPSLIQQSENMVNVETPQILFYSFQFYRVSLQVSVEARSLTMRDSLFGILVHVNLSLSWD